MGMFECSPLFLSVCFDSQPLFYVMIILGEPQKTLHVRCRRLLFQIFSELQFSCSSITFQHKIIEVSLLLHNFKKFPGWQSYWYGTFVSAQKVQFLKIIIFLIHFAHFDWQLRTELASVFVSFNHVLSSDLNKNNETGNVFCGSPSTNMLEMKHFLNAQQGYS